MSHHHPPSCQPLPSNHFSNHPSRASQSEPLDLAWANAGPESPVSPLGDLRNSIARLHRQDSRILNDRHTKWINVAFIAIAAMPFMYSIVTNVFISMYIIAYQCISISTWICLGNPNKMEKQLQIPQVVDVPSGKEHYKKVNAYRCISISMHISVYQCLSMSINVHPCISMYINVYQCIKPNNLDTNNRSLEVAALRLSLPSHHPTSPRFLWLQTCQGMQRHTMSYDHPHQRYHSRLCMSHDAYWLATLISKRVFLSSGVRFQRTLMAHQDSIRSWWTKRTRSPAPHLFKRWFRFVYWENETMMPSKSRIFSTWGDPLTHCQAMPSIISEAKSLGKYVGSSLDVWGGMLSRNVLDGKMMTHLGLWGCHASCFAWCFTLKNRWSENHVWGSCWDISDRNEKYWTPVWQLAPCSSLRIHWHCKQWSQGAQRPLSNHLWSPRPHCPPRCSLGHCGSRGGNSWYIGMTTDINWPSRGHQDTPSDDRRLIGLDGLSY